MSQSDCDKIHNMKLDREKGEVIQLCKNSQRLDFDQKIGIGEARYTNP